MSGNFFYAENTSVNLACRQNSGIYNKMGRNKGIAYREGDEK